MRAIHSLCWRCCRRVAQNALFCFSSNCFSFSWILSYFLWIYFYRNKHSHSHGEADAVSAPSNALCTLVCVNMRVTSFYDCVCDLGNASSIYSVSICETNQFNLIQIPNGWIQLKFKERLQFHMFAINRKIGGRKKILNKSLAYCIVRIIFFAYVNKQTAERK